jgi:signal transduction histidine kinase
VATFEQLGATGWADRARAALRASGEVARRGDSSRLSRLTSQELQIARLVAQGLSNREVAARLFLSPRTVDAQLRQIFDALGIASRVELAQFELAPEISSDVLRSRLARAGLAELFRDLRTMRGGALQDALARTLGDPALVVAHRLPDHDGWVDGNGDRLVLPSAGGRAIAKVERDGREIAALIYDAAFDDDPELVEAVCAAVTIVLENEHLHQESQARLAELQASRQRIVAAGDAERRRLERNLHDGAQQQLVALGMQLSLIQAGIRRDPSSAAALVTTASEQLAQSLHELRELARGIHPAVLSHGLDAALESLAGRSTVPTAVFCDVPERQSEQVELALYFVACEALANVAKYANATTASVRLSRALGGVVIEIADDGVGGADETAGTGLRGLTDRVEALGGSLLVTSPPGAGTVVTAELPLAE